MLQSTSMVCTSYFVSSQKVTNFETTTSNNNFNTAPILLQRNTHSFLTLTSLRHCWYVGIAPYTKHSLYFFTPGHSVSTIRLRYSLMRFNFNPFAPHY